MSRAGLHAVVDPTDDTVNTGTTENAGEGGRSVSEPLPAAVVPSSSFLSGARVLDSDRRLYFQYRPLNGRKLNAGLYRTQCRRCNAIVYDGSWITPPERRALHEHHRTICPSPAAYTKASARDHEATTVLSIVSTGNTPSHDARRAQAASSFLAARAISPTPRNSSAR